MPVINIHRKLSSAVSVIIPLMVTVLMCAVVLINPAFIDEYIETLLLDYRFKVRNIIAPPELPDRVMTVLIDEKSLRKYGRWPWSRKLQAELVETVFKGEPAVVGIDIFYPEVESFTADSVLADTFSRHRGRLVAAPGFEVEKSRSYSHDIPDVLYDSAAARMKNLSQFRAFEAFRVLLPPDPIAGAALFGHVYSMPDRDGKLRWDNLYLKFGDEYFPSLALKMAEVLLFDTHGPMNLIGGGGAQFGELMIPADEFGRMHINYYGHEGLINHVSAADLLDGSIKPDMFKDMVVIIGTSAIATYDLKNTPFSANMPGVEKNATVLANVLNGFFITMAGPLVNLSVVFLCGLIAMLIGLRKDAAHSLIIYCGLTILLCISNFVFFTLYDYRMNLIYPLATILVSGALVISYRYFIEERRARDIRRMFSSYVTERVVNELIKHPGMAKLGGERREVTVLFADISGFTTFSENHDPEQVVDMLNEYLGAMTDVIFRWEGTLDKFIGDAIVAFWGAPLQQNNHAELAVRCSLNMMQKLDQLRAKWIAEGKTPLSMGVGLNTGEVLVGNIGAEGKKMDYTVIGDQVNIGARVESLTRKYDTHILITEMTYSKIEELIRNGKLGHIFIQGKGNVVVKGKKHSITIYAVKALDPAMDSLIETSTDESVIHMREK
ncbi:MAG: adenylate/guanylate cyclase domain-containing protein [Nitrospira sp.]|nr:adenylate/guanylate cyclase domain-containing protein [bacterium]MBL7049723.1 adenylate/guanylate cyclase domain-containing protein [Nitrospira sp.]